MSSDIQTTLVDPERWRDQTESHDPTDGGARYGRADDARAAAEFDGADGPRNQCLSCGRDVTPALARVCGDNNGCVPACRECRDGLDGAPLKSTAETARRAREGRLAGDGGER